MTKARRTAQDDLAASITRLRALLEHLEEAQRQPNPYDWLATTPVPGQENLKRSVAGEPS